jgi:hypothetical protein
MAELHGRFCSLTWPSLFELSVDLTDTKDDYQYHRHAMAECNGNSPKQIFERALCSWGVIRRRRLHCKLDRSNCERHPHTQNLDLSQTVDPEFNAIKCRAHSGYFGSAVAEESFRDSSDVAIQTGADLAKNKKNSGFVLRVRLRPNSFCLIRTA